VTTRYDVSSVRLQGATSLSNAPSEHRMTRLCQVSPKGTSAVLTHLHRWPPHAEYLRRAFAPADTVRHALPRCSVILKGQVARRPVLTILP